MAPCPAGPVGRLNREGHGTRNRLSKYRTYTGASGDVRWDRLGHPSQPPVVLLHGTPFSSYVRRAVARPLARYPRVFVRDMPGYGTSEKDGPGRVPGRPGPGLHRAPEPLGPQEPLVVAHDFGGAVVLRAPLLHGARCRALARVDPVAPAPWGSPFFRLVGEHADDEIQALQRDRHPHARLLGEDDTWIPVAKGRELAALVPGAQLEPVAGAGHLVQTAPWCVSTSVPPAAPGLRPAVLDRLHLDTMVGVRGDRIGNAEFSPSRQGRRRRSEPS